MRSPQSGRNLIILCNIPPNASSSLLLADGRWTLLGRAHLALIPLLIHIYLLGPNQTCQSLQQRKRKSKAIYFFLFFRQCHIQYGDGDFKTSSKFVTQRNLLFIYLFWQSSSHIPICWAPSPPSVSSLDSRCYPESGRPYWDPPLLGS